MCRGNDTEQRSTSTNSRSVADTSGQALGSATNRVSSRFRSALGMPRPATDRAPISPTDPGVHTHETRGGGGGGRWGREGKETEISGEDKERGMYTQGTHNRGERGDGGRRGEVG